jgi:hypothetical protein
LPCFYNHCINDKTIINYDELIQKNIFFTKKSLQ